MFAELKNQIGLRRLRLRRLKFMREQFFLAADRNTKNAASWLLMKRAVEMVMAAGPKEALAAAH